MVDSLRTDERRKTTSSDLSSSVKICNGYAALPDMVGATRAGVGTDERSFPGALLEWFLYRSSGYSFTLCSE